MEIDNPKEDNTTPKIEIHNSYTASGQELPALIESYKGAVRVEEPTHIKDTGIYFPDNNNKFNSDDLRKTDSETPIDEKKVPHLLTEGSVGYELMYDMLTGIRSTCSTKETRNVHIKDSDFEAFRNIRFPSKGSRTTPPHMQRDFKFADYAPLVFAKIREKFGIDPGDYLDSLTKEYNLRCLTSPGKSGSIFFTTADGRFMVKTITQSECHFLQSILPGYFDHMLANPNTLIIRFFGLHRVKPHKDKKAYIIVMSSVLWCSYFKMHEIYDLKGSTVGRTAERKEKKKRSNVIYKDLDFTRNLKFGPAKQKIFSTAT